MGNAYLLVVLGIIAAKGVGFYRDMVFAKVFGTGVDADIYFQIFGLVNLIFTGIAVALSTLIIKNINQSRNIGREKAYASSFIKKSFIWLAVGVAFFVLFSGQIVKIILPGLSPAEFNLANRMMYVMIPSLIFVVVAYIISGILQNEKAYFITSVMSLPFNAVIILTLMIPDVSIMTVALVTTIGWGLQVAMLLPSFYKKGYRILGPKYDRLEKREKNPEIIWIFISNMMFQLCFYTDRAFVGNVEGMASTFNYASNLFITISSVFVVAMSTVVFPAISKNYEEGNIGYVNELLRYIITVMVAIFLPFLLVASLYGSDVIRLIYERGSFDSESTKAVSTIFFVYSLGILGYVSQELFNKILYLAGKYKYTVIGTILVVVLNVVLNLVVKNFISATHISSFGMDLVTLICASVTSLLLTFYAVAIAIGIKKVVGTYFTKELISDIIKILISGFFAFVIYFIFNTFAPDFTHGYITFVVPLCASAVVYGVFLVITGVYKKLLKREKKGTN
ncbi:MAG: hypothetical protein E7394_07215 [Ruminococcaceae bacterium]|nr:hypothetical protein [Oscillospiraceae bacterium]